MIKDIVKEWHDMHLQCLKCSSNCSEWNDMCDFYRDKQFWLEAFKKEFIEIFNVYNSHAKKVANGLILEKIAEINKELEGK